MLHGSNRVKRLTNFSYVVEGKIAASGHPGWGAELGGNLAHLREEGFRAILTVFEDPLDPGMMEEFGFEGLHLPVADFGAPTLEQAEKGVDFLKRHSRSGSRVLVHCFGGYGRTGTMLACYLIDRGNSAKDAIKEVRRLRPGSIEDPSQEDLIFTYERERQGSTAREKPSKD